MKSRIKEEKTYGRRIKSVTYSLCTVELFSDVIHSASNLFYLNVCERRCIRCMVFSEHVQNRLSDLLCSCSNCTDFPMLSFGGVRKTYLWRRDRQWSVSYTHLDVYKRQVWDRKRRLAEVRFCFPEISGMCRSMLRIWKTNSRICLLYTSRCV